MKPHSAACERNREPILEVLAQWFIAPGVVLEIGAGTGQHAVHFAARLPHLDWQPTDREAALPGLRLWVEEAGLANLRAPAKLDVREPPWPLERARYVFSANTAHIMSWPEVELMFAGIGAVLEERGIFCLYGPFNRDGRHTSESNRAFDESLKARDPNMGLRDDQALIALGRRHGLRFTAEHSLPAQNRLLVWVREGQAEPRRTA